GRLRTGRSDAHHAVLGSGRDVQADTTDRASHGRRRRTLPPRDRCLGPCNAPSSGPRLVAGTRSHATLRRRRAGRRSHRAAMNHLERYLRAAPMSLALERAIEARWISSLPLVDPVLDVGCGDGLFAERTFASRLAVGMDRNPAELAIAQT